MKPVGNELDKMAGFEDEINEEVQDTGEEEDTSSEQGSTDDSGHSTQEQQDGTTTASQPTAKSGKLHADQQGNLVDGDGNLIARAGKERREFSQFGRIQQELVQLRNIALEHKQADTLLQSHGVSKDELPHALVLYATLKRDPVKGAALLLEQIKAAGHNLDGMDMGAINMNALSRMIDEKIKPFISDRQAGERDVELRNQAVQQYETFISEYPDAVVHEDVLANMLSQGIANTPEAAYNKLLKFAMQHRLDWSKPLKSQITQVQQEQEPQPQAPQPRRSITPGSAGRNAQAVPRETAVSTSTSYKDIVADVLRSAGLSDQ